jgi:hypothetical protein
LTIGKSKHGLREHGADIVLQRFLTKIFLGELHHVAVALAVRE